MCITIDGSGLTIDKLVRIARHKEKIELSEAAIDRIIKCRNMLEEKIQAKEIIRKYVDFLDIDRPLYTDHTAMKGLVKSCEILEEVENSVGSLE